MTIQISHIYSTVPHWIGQALSDLWPDHSPICPSVWPISSSHVLSYWSLISVLHIRFYFSLCFWRPPPLQIPTAIKHQCSGGNPNPNQPRAPGREGYSMWEGLKAEDMTLPLSDTETILQKSQYTELGWWYSDLLTSHWLWERRKQPTGSQRHLGECGEWQATPTCSNVYTVIPSPLCRHALVTLWLNLLGCASIF